MPNDTHGTRGSSTPRPDRDASGTDHSTGGWIAEAIRARSVQALTDVARRARTAGELTPRDQQWCRALAEYLSTDVDGAALRLLTAELGARPVTGNGSGA